MLLKVVSINKYLAQPEYILCLIKYLDQVDVHRYI